MITTVTLNPAVDKVYYIDHFAVDKINRVADVSAVPGGKGINVAKVARVLGAEVTASGFLGGANGRFIEKMLEVEGIHNDFVWIAGDTRETITVIDRIEQTQTELLEPGPMITQQEVKVFIEKLTALSQRSKVVSFSGSLPRGLPVDMYAQLVQIAQQSGALTVLDSSGESLSKGLKGRPFLCKPNLDELEQWLGYRLDGEHEIVLAAQNIVREGVQVVVVSMGKKGAIAVTEHGVWKIEAPSVQSVNTVGCGDAMVGGIVTYLDRLDSVPSEDDLIEAFILGTAAGASNAINRTAGQVKPEEVDHLKSSVKVKNMNVSRFI